MRRLANTARKLVGAAARLRGSGVASVGDVELAEEMLKMKLEVLRWLYGETPRVVPIVGLSREKKQADRNKTMRYRYIMQQFGGHEVTLEQLTQYLGYSERTLRRELREQGGLPCRRSRGGRDAGSHRCDGA